MLGSLAARLTFLAAVFAIVVSGGAATTGASAAGKPTRTISAANQLESNVLDELNEVRRAHRLAPLRLSTPLAAAADAHSRAMGRFGFFQHDSRDGSAFWHRVKRYSGSNGSANWSVGENLLWSTTGLDAERALELWMASPGHRKNILTERWREVGLAAVTVPAAPGVFGGRDVVIITTDFGVRN